MVYLKHKNRSTPSRRKNRINKKERIIRESTENSENKKIFKRSKLTLNIMRSATKKVNFSWVSDLLIIIKMDKGFKKINYFILKLSKSLYKKALKKIKIKVVKWPNKYESLNIITKNIKGKANPISLIIIFFEFKAILNWK